MPEKQTRPDTEPQKTDNPSPRPKGIRRPDGRTNPEKLKENQQSLGVGADHRTPDMKKGHRGTFP